MWKAYEITGDEDKFHKDTESVYSGLKCLEAAKTDLEGKIAQGEGLELDITAIKEACVLVKSRLKELSSDYERIALEALRLKIWVSKGSTEVTSIIPIVVNQSRSSTHP